MNLKQSDCRAQPPDHQDVAVVLTIVIVTNHLELESLARTLLMLGALSYGARPMFARRRLQKKMSL